MHNIENVRFLINAAEREAMRRRSSNDETRRENLWIYAAAVTVAIMLVTAIIYAAVR